MTIVRWQGRVGAAATAAAAPAAAALAAAVLAAGTAAAQDSHPGTEGPVLLWPPETELRILLPEKPGPAETDALERFRREADYFGAFALAAGPVDLAHRFHGAQSPEIAAEAVFRASMAEVPQGTTCVVLAEAVPRGWARRLGKRVDLGAVARRGFKDVLARRQSLPGAEAFAISALAQGWSWGHPDRATAARRALQEGTDASPRSLLEHHPAARDSLRDAGADDCRIIAAGD